MSNGKDFADHPNQQHRGIQLVAIPLPAGKTRQQRQRIIRPILFKHHRQPNSDLSIHKLGTVGLSAMLVLNTDVRRLLESIAELEHGGGTERELVE